MAVNYFDGPRGYPGTLVTGTDTAGVAKRYVIPAMTIVDQTGTAQPAGTSADPTSVTLASPTTPWNYAAAAGGITNTTTAVTLKSAAGAGIRNYMTAFQFSNSTLGAGTEVVIRDGAGGTVLWRGVLATAANNGADVTFETPLRSSANSLLEFATLTATATGAVYVNAQGYTGA